MFFAIDLLLPQHGGKFAIAWISATRGIRYVNKRAIGNCDVSKLCDEILKMVTSQSSRPHLRLSLSLASKLTNGLIRIYREQLNVLQSDLVHFLMQVRRPMIPISPSATDIESETTPVPKVSKKRKRKIVLTPPEQLVPEFADFDIVIDEQALARPSEHQIDSTLITLPEEMPVRSHIEIDLGEMGDFGILEDTAPPTFPELLLPADLPLQEKEPVEKVVTMIRDQSPPPKRAHAEIEQQQVLSPQVPEDTNVQVVPQISQPEIEMAVELPQTEPQVVPIKRNKRQPSLAKVIIKAQKRSAVNIDRCVPGEKQFFDIMKYENRFLIKLVKQHQLENVNIQRVLASFMEEIELADRSERSRRASSILPESSKHTTRFQKSDIRTPLTEIQLPQEPHQIDTRADVHATSTKRHRKSMEKVTQRLHDSEMIQQPLVESTELPILETHIAPPDGTIDIIAPPAANTVLQRHEDLVFNVSPTSSTEKQAISKNRQKRILEIIKNWDSKVQGDVTIEDVCQTPINRRNVALAFSDLLTMHKMGYVKLINMPDSLKLKNIEKGKNILKKH